MNIDAIRDDYRVYYCYLYRRYSIKNEPINQQKLDLIYNALLLMKRFKGVQHFDWMDEVDRQLYTTSQFGEKL